jgi:hypothetical protein
VSRALGLAPIRRVAQEGDTHFVVPDQRHDQTTDIDIAKNPQIALRVVTRDGAPHADSVGSPVTLPCRLLAPLAVLPGLRPLLLTGRATRTASRGVAISGLLELCHLTQRRGRQRRAIPPGISTEAGRRPRRGAGQAPGGCISSQRPRPPRAVEVRTSRIPDQGHPWRARNEASLCQGDPSRACSRSRSALVTGLLAGRSVVSGSGVTGPKSRPSGCRVGHAGLHESFLSVLPDPPYRRVVTSTRSWRQTASLMRRFNARHPSFLVLPSASLRWWAGSRRASGSSASWRNRSQSR